MSAFNAEQAKVMRELCDTLIEGAADLEEHAQRMLDNAQMMRWMAQIVACNSSADSTAERTPVNEEGGTGPL